MKTNETKTIQTTSERQFLTKLINSKLYDCTSQFKRIDGESEVSYTSTKTSFTQTSNHTPTISKCSIVWLDSKVNSLNDVYQNSIIHLQRITSTIHTFTNISDCEHYLRETDDGKIVVVVSYDFVQEIWPLLRSMPQVHSIYIISEDGEKKILSILKTDKTKSISSLSEPMCTSTKKDVSYQNKRNSLGISIIPARKYTKSDLKQLNESFIYSIMIRLIIHSARYENENHKESRNQLAKLFQNEYCNNDDELLIIDEFVQKYHQHSPIWWYTRNCFLSVALNQALQTQDTKMIMKFQFFIKDLYQQLERSRFNLLKINKFPIIAYYKHYALDEDLKWLENAKGNLLSFNKFITADSSNDELWNSACCDSHKDARVGVIFRIKIESNHASTSFISLENSSFYPSQGNSLFFSMSSIFLIVDIKQSKNGLWEVDLVLTTAIDEHVKSITALLKEATRNSLGWLKLADLMSTIGSLDQAKEIYHIILQLTPESEPLKIANIYNKLGNIDDESGDYLSALKFYEHALQIRQKSLPPHHRLLSISYNNLGLIKRKLGDYFIAHSYHEKTLDLKKQILSPGDLSLATTYNNLALVDESLGDFKHALEYHKKALDIKLKSLPADHQELGIAYNNIGEILRLMGDFPGALDNLEKALNIRLKKYSLPNSSLAISYNNIGLVHRELGNYSVALSFLNKSLDIKLNTFPPHHPSLAFTYNNIGDVHQQMAEYTEALDAYQKALKIQQNAFSENHPELAITYTHIGSTLQALGQYSKALSFYEKAVKIRQAALPMNHPLIGLSYNNIGHFYHLMGQYTNAFEYFLKTLDIQEQCFGQNHPSLSVTYNNLADIQRNLGNHTRALRLYQKSLDIKKRFLPPYHPTLIITYNNIGTVYQSMKNYSAALEYYTKTLEIQQKSLPMNHPTLASAYNNIGVAHHSMEDYTKALDYYKKALENQIKILPLDHPDIAITYNSMGTAYASLGEYERALEHVQRAVDIASKTFEDDHPHLKIFRNYLEQIRMRVQSTDTN